MKLSTLLRLTLLGMLAIGAGLALRESVTQRELLAVANRLHLDFDQLCAKNPDQVFVKAIPTRRLHDYAWLVHFPKEYVIQRLTNINEMTLSNPKPLSDREIVTVRLSLRGKLNQYSCRFHIGDMIRNGCRFSTKSENDRLLLGEVITGERPHSVEQLGADSIIELSPSEEIPLLEISTKLNKHDRNFSVLKLLPPEPQEKDEADGIR